MKPRIQLYNNGDAVVTFNGNVIQLLCQFTPRKLKDISCKGRRNPKNYKWLLNGYKYAYNGSYKTLESAVKCAIKALRT